jgi:hypothetical protein
VRRRGWAEQNDRLWRRVLADARRARKGKQSVKAHREELEAELGIRAEIEGLKQAPRS